MLKKLIIKILNLIRLFLTAISILNSKIKHILKKHVLPENNQHPYSSFLTKVFHLYEDEQVEKSYKTYRKYFDNSVFLNYWDLKNIQFKNLWKMIITKKIYLEFGVLGGGTINLFSKYLKTNIYGFNSFIG